MSPIDWMDAKSLDFGTDPGSGPDPKDAERRKLLLEELNEPQQAAVQYGEGPLLILAGAGSGKTRAITRRIAWLVTVENVPAPEILAITFTNKAAKEMRERVHALTEERGMWICTFHAMCARILRRDIQHLGLWTGDFTIYDTHDRNTLIKNLIKDAGYDTTRFRPAVVGSWISEAKTHSAENGALPLEGLGMEDEVLARVYEKYTERMRASNALDFDDLLLLTLKLFEEHPGVRDVYASRFHHVLVDEYQDTNRVQYRLVRHLVKIHGNLCVCGDPDQSIYAWRGADVRNILDFERDFGGAPVVKLEQNYRSHGNILKAAQAVISHNRQRKEKDLWTEAPDGDPIALLECGDENDEASEIAARIQSHVKAGGKYEDAAIFYRVNFMQRALERALRLSGVPYQIVGGVEFYQRREIRDLIAYLHLLVNPADDIACTRILNVPPRGIGQKSVEVLRQWASARGVSLLSAVRSEEARAEVRGRAKKSLEAFSQLQEQLLDCKTATASDALERILDETDYFAYLRDVTGDDLETREENVEELRTHAASYDRENPEGGLRGFLEDVALVSDIDGMEDADGGVTLMTLHSAKGLEFPLVFVAGVEEEFLPHARAVFEAADEDGACEEERRLFYVGMTRARRNLMLTWARTRLHFGEASYRRPSRFLEEIPPELLAGGGVWDEAAEEELLGAFDAPEAPKGLAEGVWVDHDHFGRGIVKRLQGSGVNARATVSFSRHGDKELLLQYANLRLVEASR